MSKTPAQNKRGKGGRFVTEEESAPEAQNSVEAQEGGGWERGEGFGSIGPVAFGTPDQQASLADLQALHAGVQDEQAKSREVAEASGLRVEQLSEDVLGISKQIATLTTAVMVEIRVVVRSDVAPQSVIDLRCSRARSLLGGAMTFV